MRAVRIISEYKAAYESALTLTPGERVTVGKGDSEWPGWYWCSNDKGESAWVHESFFSVIDNDGSVGEAVKDYSSRELSVRAGDKIIVEYELGGWLWGEDSQGSKGWIPAGKTDWHE